MSRLGPLREREFRLLFTGQAVSRLGSAMAPIALAFAVLDLTGSTADLGLVLAARQVTVIVFLLFGGVWADRLPRHRVMVFSNLTSGLSQAIIATLLLTGRAHLWHIVAFAMLNGASSAFFAPASTGIVPQTVPASLLQQANAVLRLAINGTNLTGAALGGILVAAGGPGWAIAADAASYGVASIALASMRVRPPERTEGTTVLHELRVGWHDFWSRTWLWVIVLQFGIVNAAWTGVMMVLGPAIAKAHLGGPAAWGAVLTASTVGFFSCGFLMLRWQPRRVLRVATLAVYAMALPLVALARPEPLTVVIVSAFVAGFATEIFGVLWDTALQQEIPQDKLSRISSYDALGSWVLMPLGFAVAGPVSNVVGVRATFLGGAVLIVAATALALLSRDLRPIERTAF